MISAWSLSRLDVYETCPYRAYLQYVERVPTPELKPGPDQKEHPLTRGLRIHKAAEDFVTGDILLIDELQVFNDAFDLQRARFRERPDACVVEAEWAIDQNWERTSWSGKSAWGRMKLDWGYVEDTRMEIVDYKTGKKYPTKHVQQGQLYALVSSIFYPEVEEFKVEFWYPDQNDKLEQKYSKLQVQVLKDGFDRRARAMTKATEFPPRSSAYACRFCPYGEGRDGNKYCEYRFSYDD